MIAAITSRLVPWLKLWPLTLALAAFAAGWTTNGWRWEAKQASALQAEIDRRVKAEQDANAASSRAEKERERSRKVVRDAERKLTHERQSNPDYGCAVPDYGLQLYNQPRTVADTPGQPDGPVPAP